MLFSKFILVQSDTLSTEETFITIDQDTLCQRLIHPTLPTTCGSLYSIGPNSIRSILKFGLGCQPAVKIRLGDT